MLWVMILAGVVFGALMDGWSGALVGGLVGAGACLFVAGLVWVGNSGGRR